ncbi:nuclear pore protein 84/107 [Triangularia verruculosa]|uniref:Nuclear pore complex protein n=1 Tax=Triangularia verruculosa TaxID=2587418 RepID=A0AAN6XC39_9PEZI|nr:nuclear pore protein 84/107 [Triangularia verruculosa]
MAPAFNFPSISQESSRASSESRFQEPPHNEMTDLESTYRQSTVRVGNDVDFFAAELDRYNTDLTGGSNSEKRAHVYKLLDSYYNYTRKRVDRLQASRAAEKNRGGIWQRPESVDMDIDEEVSQSSASAEDVRRAEEEAQTWDLLRRILPLRYQDLEVDGSKKDGKQAPQSRRDWWEEFLITDSMARERKIVLEWLQNSASHGPPVDEVVSELQHNAERGDILAHGWLHTRHKIKLQKSVNGYQGVLGVNAGTSQSHLGSNTLITQLDPDAVTRQGRKLEPQDEFFERAIWLGCFEMLRRGCSMSEIRDWCAERTELWRAATIAPLPLSNPQDEEQFDFEPSSLVLWRRMCYAAARDGGTSEYDRAVYGLLAGDLESVEKVCKSWDDRLFAHYNALLRTQFDLFLMKKCGKDLVEIAARFPAFNAVVYHSEPTTVAKRLVASLETDPKIGTEALRASKSLHAAIIADDLGRYLFHQGVVLAKKANARAKSKLIPEINFPMAEAINENKFVGLGDYDGLRTLAHVLIVVDTLDRLSGPTKESAHRAIRQAQENIIASYVSYLRLANLEELVPLYCSKLHDDRLYEALGRNLIHIVGDEHREHQLIIMSKLGVDIKEFGRRLPLIYLNDVNDKSVRCEAKGQFKILEDGPATLKYGRIVKPDFIGDDSNQMEGESEELIRSLEWLMWIPGLFLETCTYAIRIYKYFLKRADLRAARALSIRVSGRAIAMEKLTFITFVDENVDDTVGVFDEIANATITSDFLEECGVSRDRLLNVVRNLWELECLVRALDSMETLSSMAGLSRDPSHPPAREMWTQAGGDVRNVKNCMQPVLHNWLMVANEDDQDFRDLREAYIPETVIAYISTLHFAGGAVSRDNFMECMDLAALIAEKDSGLAQEFVKAGRMKELLESFAACSKALAVSTAESKGKSSKRHRELGWSRELWSIKP